MHSMPPICGPSNFYPRPLRGGRRGGRADQFRGVQISIHALCEEGDRPTPPRSWPQSTFLSTPSARRATKEPTKRAGTPSYFYPRPLRGGRQPDYRRLDDIGKFLSTPSARRATRGSRALHYQRRISIHALCEEGDGPPCIPPPPPRYFYPRPLRGGRQTGGICARILYDFYPRPLRGGRRGGRGPGPTVERISIHALCEEGDVVYNTLLGQLWISIHALCEEGDVKVSGGHA